MWGCKLRPDVPTRVCTGPHVFRLKNLCLFGVDQGLFELSICPVREGEASEDDRMLICLMAPSESASVDICFDGEAELELRPNEETREEQVDLSRAMVHVLGHKEMVEGAEGGGAYATTSDAPAVARESKDGRKRAVHAATQPKPKRRKEASPPSVHEEDGEDEEDEEETGEEADAMSEEGTNEVVDEGDDEEEDEEEEEEEVQEPQTEDEYKQAIVMYLRQRGVVTLQKLGTAIKKPPVVKKSLKKFIQSIKLTKGKRLGTALDITDDKVSLIMKSNYDEGWKGEERMNEQKKKMNKGKGR